ncbi:unnamed protein product [Onchocerca ochengi]|uniref:Ig-like domain-containing protein n=1 Tax=Onchocerca ochengi TaxID=42157 RepID=A0A182E2D3_ONCOC|nr:unnamed protein product [Onchocerca ochengi]
MVTFRLGLTQQSTVKEHYSALRLSQELWCHEPGSNRLPLDGNIWHDSSSSTAIDNSPSSGFSTVVRVRNFYADTATVSCYNDPDRRSDSSKSTIKDHYSSLRAMKKIKYLFVS